ncbi:MAG: DUF2513 domain-containing protein [Porticoccus sp.]|nr:DUF2513 domain-containing protein [Porticoccus sp.]|tara:strand:+ start:133 stop:513 length:381 start_codon:yes stop_codon:yes gene_type:complete
MKRDWDLIRRILLEIENSPDMDTFLNFSESGYLYTDNLKDYEKEQIIYHIQLLINAGFISTNADLYGEQEITGLSWKGHEYAEKLRDTARWEMIKSYISEKGLDLGSDTIMSLIRKGINKIIDGDK